MFFTSVEINELKAKDSRNNAAPLCFYNSSKKLLVDNMKNYADLPLNFQLIIIVLVLMIFWIFLFMKNMKYIMKLFMKNKNEISLDLLIKCLLNYYMLAQ